jgi:hypothetical protein
MRAASPVVTRHCWKICFVIFSVEYFYYPLSRISSTDRFLSLARVVSQCSGYARFELQVRIIPHWEEDIIYSNGLLFEVQYCPDIVQCLLAEYEVIQRCCSSRIVFYYVRGQVS